MIPEFELSGEWFRCVSSHRDPLSSEGARRTGGRLNQIGEAGLYLAGTPTLAVAESLMLGNLYGVARFAPRLLVTVEVVISRVIDLRVEQVRAGLGLSAEDLVADWRPAARPTRMQRAGDVLLRLGVEAAIFPSVIELGSVNIVVFACNVDAAKSLRVVGRES